MRTIESFLKELQPEHRDAAIKAMKKQRFDLNELVSTHASAIYKFNWFKTSEGANYWTRIYDNLLNRVYVFPPQPVKDAKEFIAPTGEAETPQIDLHREYLTLYSNVNRPLEETLYILMSQFTLQRK